MMLGLALALPAVRRVRRNIVTNGDFSNGTTGWTAGTGGTLSVVAGALNIAASADLGSGHQVLTTVAGRSYRLQMTTSAVSHQIELRDGAVIGAGTLIVNSGTRVATTYTFTFTALSTATQLRLFTRFAGATATFDDIVVEEV